MYLLQRGSFLMGKPHIIMTLLKIFITNCIGGGGGGDGSGNTEQHPRNLICDSAGSVRVQ